MTIQPPAYLFEGDRSIGTVTAVTPDQLQVNFPLAAADEPQVRYGQRVGAGEVGEFVVVEAGDVGIFGRVTEVRLPERDRLGVEPGIGRTADAHPIGVVRMLCTVPVSGGAPTRGISRHPRVGATVYSLDPALVGWIAEHAGGDDEGSGLRLSLAYLPGSADSSIRVTPERLFGRHCAVLGATGGGKSWTLARIVERCAVFNAKVLLLDATGEYHTLTEGVRHVSLGASPDLPEGCEDVVLPYTRLSEDDLFALFRPGTQVQAPKLREAIKSLKLAACVPDDDAVTEGFIVKANRARAHYDAAYAAHAATVDDSSANFDIHLLPRQVGNECVWPTAFGQQHGERDATRWGGPDTQAFSQCVTLIGRIENYLAAPEFAPVLQPGDRRDLIDLVQDWLSDGEFPVLRVSLRNLAFAADVREIVANGIGRSLLNMARDGSFGSRPLVVCLDEAHQFLNRTIGDEYTRFPLDAFDLIAKEGRKYSLSICIATQRPRDLPEAVLGQMGTLLVHRLTNDADRRVVERAAGDIDRSAAAFLPSLAPGQALLLGVDYPIPLIINVSQPTAIPDSRGPDFQSHWAAPA